jgi:tetratricopeptide (TPR) repeat protein
VAEFISSLQIDSRGRLTLGTPIAGHLLTLRRQAMQPMATVLGATAESSVFRDSSQRRLFEAQSWIVVHYLTLGDQRRRTQIGSFVKESLAGSVPEEAFQRAFQSDPEALGYLLSDYFARSIFRLHFEAGPARESGGVEPTELAEHDANMIMGDALVQSGDVAAALKQLEHLSLDDARSPNARGLLARIRLVQGDRVEAVRLFSEAANDFEADERWRYYYAAALLNETAPIRGSEVTAADARRAEQELFELRTRHPNHADVLALLGVAQLRLENPGGAVKYLSSAFTLCPRHQYALLLGRARIASGDTAGAQRLLTDLAVRGRTQAVRDEASGLLGRIPEGPLRSLASVPVYRTPSADEMKTSGHLTEIVCAPNWIVFNITTADGLIRLAAGSFERVELLSYKRGAGSQTISCGKREGRDPVWAIWRPMANAPEGVDGFVRAIEFIAQEP